MHVNLVDIQWLITLVHILTEWTPTFIQTEVPMVLGVCEKYNYRISSNSLRNCY